jgi:thiamine pyrophosphate-dependent acetolactate synthase large subunit-like protein
LPGAGFALPAAIAAHLAHPDRRIVCFTGADELQATALDLDTVRRLGGPIVLVVFGDGASGAPDPTALARSVGLSALSTAGDVRFGEALRCATQQGGPALIVVRP